MPRRPQQSRLGPLGLFEQCNGKYLTREEEATATTHERILSCWRIIIKMVNQAIARKPPSSRPLFNQEDVLSEVYMELMIRDSKWEHARSSYISFVISIVPRIIESISEKSHQLKVPPKSHNKLKKGGDATTGTLRKMTLAVNGFVSSPEEPPFLLDPPEILEIEYRARAISNLVEIAMDCLTPIEKEILCRSHGYDFEESQSVQQICESLGIPRDVVVATLIRASIKVIQTAEQNKEQYESIFPKES